MTGEHEEFVKEGGGGETQQKSFILMKYLLAEKLYFWRFSGGKGSLVKREKGACKGKEN